MTVTNTSIQTVNQGNGATTVFNYSFLIPALGEYQVIYTDTAGVITVLNGALYTITGIANPAGGTVTYPLVGSPIATGTTLTIRRVLPLTQTVSLANQGGFYPSTVDDALDYVTMLAQQIAAWANSPGWGGTTTNIGSAFSLTVPNFLLTDGAQVKFIANAASTGASTLNVNVGGALPLVTSAGAALVSGTMALSTLYIATYVVASGSWYLK